MRFIVQHDTHYRYDVPVMLAPHVLRLTPRASENRVLSRSLAVQPQPTDLREEIDPFGNQVTRATFAAVPTDHLHIESRFELDTVGELPPPPAAMAFARLPWPAVTGTGLDQGAYDAGVWPFARALAAEVDDQPWQFLDHLCQTLHARTDGHVRLTGDAQQAAETLATWRGACRDLTVLFMAAARSLGLLSRFCSGYQAAPQTSDGQRYLHAWPEVFLPGLGWRGWDPTNGVRAGDGHVALCAAPDQAGTMPVVGGYYFGSAITATLDYEVKIRTL